MHDPQRLRRLPGIDRLLAGAADVIARHGRHATADALRAVVDEARTSVLAGGAVPDDTTLLAAAAAYLEARRPPPLRPVINATGVVVHTNLGRAPLALQARAAMVEASGYCDLEFDLPSGQRGSRAARLEPLLCAATGAEAAFAVNNAAAALVLVLATLAHGRDVIVSRGELIEIGGSFRLPDIMAASGARMVEVGTTNRTHGDDYLVGDDAAAILTLHPSNYRIVGFVAQPSVSELAVVAAKRGVPLIYDTGSGLLQPTGGALKGEPAVAQALRDGADLVLCSGDKLLGGPQAGIIAGTESAISQVRRHPLMRALRVDKMTYAALEATLQEHAAGRAAETVPVIRMLTMTTAEIGDRARALAVALAGAPLRAEIIDGVSTIGGGSAPGSALPTKLVALAHPALNATDLEARLRALDLPIIARIENDRVVLDLRTVAPEDDELLERLLRVISA
jgi:L-seryl-tRNA(Ser) seleniumtransferase